MTGERYVIVGWGSENDDGIRDCTCKVLPEEFSIEDAKNAFRLAEAFADARFELDLAYLAMDGNEPVTDDTSLVAMGFDVLVDYAPILTAGGNI